MPKSCSIIIGAGLGDEGKGHYADILCNRPSTLDIRFNGGSQAAHTVVTPDGKRHAFRHIGAGTFTGAATYLSEYFLVNPVTFVIEHSKLEEDFKVHPIVYVNPNSPVTTLFDMYINQAVEEHRDKERHGSVGLGIWETVERNNNPLYKLTVKDMYLKTPLKEKLKRIQGEYVPKRLKEEYGLELSNLRNLSCDYAQLLSSDETIEMFLGYVAEFFTLVNIRGNDIINCFDNLVFEGGQGLGLDENNPDCSPDFLTPSTTGVTNAMKILQNIGFKDRPDIYYLSRAYATRHGVGPLEHEADSVKYARAIDKTNRPNQFQGSLRFAYIDFDVLAKRIKDDISKITIPSRINIGLTCLDQLYEPVGIGSSSGIIKYPAGEFVKQAKQYFSKMIPQISGFSGTYGLTRDEFEEF